MAETDPSERDDRAQAVLRVVEQAIAGAALAEEMLDAQQPGWDAPRKGRGSRRHGPAGPAFSLRSACHTAWTNAAHLLIHDHGFEPWQVPPMPTRDDGEVSLWQYGPDGRITVSAVDSWEPEPPETSAEPVRPVWRPTERLYTLEEAREILGTCEEHDWVVEEDAGTPVAIACVRKGCPARKPVTWG